MWSSATHLTRVGGDLYRGVIVVGVLIVIDLIVMFAVNARD